MEARLCHNVTSIELAKVAHKAIILRLENVSPMCSTLSYLLLSRIMLVLALTNYVSTFNDVQALKVSNSIITKTLGLKIKIGISYFLFPYTILLLLIYSVMSFHFVTSELQTCQSLLSQIEHVLYSIVFLGVC